MLDTPDLCRTKAVEIINTLQLDSNGWRLGADIWLLYWGEDQKEEGDRLYQTIVEFTDGLTVAEMQEYLDSTNYDVFKAANLVNDQFEEGWTFPHFIKGCLRETLLFIVGDLLGPRKS